ncbi:uncharacterized protein LOC126661863 [Mercurialis annua]|uniref:uncharacterized protein LOC126661863 n=1 Tax=Mercurialis annua TaxID=3986 RepID=UPI002160D66B|nr:uncharacterized protein LOC126661863 [Mercurialis annua]
MKVEDNSSTTLLTMVYANLNASLHKHLLQDLDVLASSISEPWIIGGDYNAALYNWERKGGAVNILGGCRLFKNWFDHFNLIDLGFTGSLYTWKRGNLIKRLDRFIRNDLWVSNPIYLQFNIQKVSKSEPKAFRFLAAWLGDKAFPELVKNIWSEPDTFSNSIQKFTGVVKDWNFKEFGNIFKKKNSLLARLGEIQKALDMHHSQNLRDREKHLRIELDKVLFQEELFWFQKSRTEWITDGDRNTAFYHKNVSHMRRMNNIKVLKNEYGEIVEDQTLLKGMARDYFQKLY